MFANSQIPNLPLDFARRSVSTAMTWPRILAMTRGLLRCLAARLACQSATDQNGEENAVQTCFFLGAFLKGCGFESFRVGGLQGFRVPGLQGFSFRAVGFDCWGCRVLHTEEISETTLFRV